MANAPATVQVGGALTTDGTSIYAFQGKTTGFWRYNVAHQHLDGARRASRPSPTRAAPSSYLPAVNPQGRFSDADVSRSRRRATRQGDAELSARQRRQPTSSPGALTTTPTGGASCSALTRPDADERRQQHRGTGDPVTYKWTCTVAAGANAGESLTFAASATAQRRP